MTSLRGKFSAIIYDNDTAWEDHYSSKFRARRAVMLHAVRLGWSLEDCRIVFANPVNPGSRLWTHGSNERPIRPAEVTKRLMRDYQSAHAVVMAQPSYQTAAEARQRVGELIAEAKVNPWSGRAGRTDRDVLAALHAAATAVGTDAVDMSVRDIALAAGVAHRDTVTRSLRRLEKAGWLSKPETPRFGKAQRYKLSGPLPAHITVSGEVHIHVGSYGASVFANHEVWLRLGKAAMALYQVLDVAPASARKLAERAGVNRKTANRQLPVLRSYDLASGSKNQGWSFGVLSPDEVVKAMGWIEDNSKDVNRRKAVNEDRVMFLWNYFKLDKAAA
jgi:hypothetical protein